MAIKFWMPTNFYLGKNAVAENSNVFISLGKKALIVTGKRSAEISGAQEDCIAMLQQNNIEYSIYNKIEANPSIESALEGAQIAKDQKVDFIIGIGGGSPLDAAKAIALFAKGDVSRQDIVERRFPAASLPVIAIPTTAGTGSEVTPYCVLTNVEKKIKASISSPDTFAYYAIADAKYTESLPPHVAVNTTIDALTHAIEGMLSKKHNNMSDLLAKESIRLICERLPLLEKNTIPYEDREALLYASSLAGMVISQTGTTAVHAMGYALTNYKNIDHGRANALLIGGFLKFIQKQDSQRIDEIIQATYYPTLQAFCSAINALLGDIEPITKEECEFFTDLSMDNKNISASAIVPEKSDVLAIFYERFQS